MRLADAARHDAAAEGQILCGPLFLAGTNTMIGETTFGTNGNCSGVGYDTRLDTASAQSFIFGTARSLGLTIP